MNTSSKQLQIMGHAKALAPLCRAFQRVWSLISFEQVARQWIVLSWLFLPPYFNIVNFEKTQTGTLDIGTLNPESCSNTELKMQTVLPICWDFEIVTTVSLVAFKLISRTQKSYVFFFNQYIIIHRVLIFQATQYNPRANMALTLYKTFIYESINFCLCNQKGSKICRKVSQQN